MVKSDKSEAVKNLLTNLITISGRKTDRGYAMITLDKVMRELENKYFFLKHVRIKDTRYIEDLDAIQVMPDINYVDSLEMGKALQDIITTMDNSLGENAGHFFLKELISRLDDSNKMIISDMGVDLSIMQLEREVKKLERTVAKKDNDI
jgi:hypothetical protein